MFDSQRGEATNSCVPDLQEVTQRVLEAVGGIAGSSLEQTSWLSRSLEVKVQPQICEEADEADDADMDGDHDGSASSQRHLPKSLDTYFKRLFVYLFNKLHINEHVKVWKKKQSDGKYKKKKNITN